MPYASSSTAEDQSQKDQQQPHFMQNSGHDQNYSNYPAQEFYGGNDRYQAENWNHQNQNQNHNHNHNHNHNQSQDTHRYQQQQQQQHHSASGYENYFDYHSQDPNPNQHQIQPSPQRHATMVNPHPVSNSKSHFTQMNASAPVFSQTNHSSSSLAFENGHHAQPLRGYSKSSSSSHIPSSSTIQIPEDSQANYLSGGGNGGGASQSLHGSRKPARKPPSSHQFDHVIQEITDNSRRVVSTPPQHNYSQALPSDSRTKSLSSTSTSASNRFRGSSQQSTPQLDQPPVSSNRPSITGSSSPSLNHSFSIVSKSRSFSSMTKLTSLSSKKFGSSSSISKNEKQSVASSKTLVSHPSQSSSVYPALLSEVAKLFKDAIILTINTKDGLEYHDTFTGKMAVDILCRIIRTNDRNLALLIGRSLDAQKFFHDVTYNHRLRDSVHEIYAFNHVYNDVEFFHDDGNSSNNNSATTSKHGSFVDSSQFQQAMHDNFLSQQLPSQVNQSSTAADYAASQLNRLSGGNSNYNYNNNTSSSSNNNNNNNYNLNNTSNNNIVTVAAPAAKNLTASQQTGVNGVFTILTDCYSPTCSRNHLCYSIACPRRLEQQARLNLKPQGGLKRAVSKLSLHDQEENETLWHKTVPQSVLDNLDKHERTRQELIYEFIYTERDYVKDLEFMTDFYIMPLINPANNIIPENQRETFIHTVFGGVNDLLRLGKSFSEALTKRQQQQKPVIESIGDIFLEHVGDFEPFVRYSGNKVFATFEHERQQQVNMKYPRFLDAIEKKPESRRQDLSSFLIKGVQRPARYQLLLAGILKHTKPESPDYKNLVKAKEEIEALLVRINIQTGESTDRHKIMVLHRLLGKQTLESKFNFKLSYYNRIIYQVTLNRKRDNEKIDLYLFEHALLLVKHKIQNKREHHKVFEKPILLPLLFVNSGFEIPTSRTLMHHRYNMSVVSDVGLRNQRAESTNYIGNTLSSNNASKFQLNILGMGSNQVHASLFAEDVAIQSQVLQQISQQQKKLIDANDLFSMSKYETRRFAGNNKINCAVPCYGGKKLLYGTDSGVWVSTVRSISSTSTEKICSDPTMVISKPYTTQIEVLVEYSKLLVLSDKVLYEFDLSCTDSLDHVKNTKSGKLIMTHVSFFKIGVCDGKLLVIGAKTGSQHSICIFEPLNPFDPKQKNRNKNKIEYQEIPFTSDPISISFLKSKLCIGCTKGFEILSLQSGSKEPILDEADPSLDFATQRESVTPLAIHKLGKDFLLSYSEFVFLIKGNGWRTNHEWGIFWEGNPRNVALFFPYLLSFEPGFIEIRDLHTTNLLRALVGDNIRYLHSNEHEAMFACEENGYDIIISIDFLNLKPKSPSK
ncbi:uncharacterized protein LODBEIA_P46440 [Lodderomyces beijingensis]|uniref:RHO1 GDP-GTP exchange protein 2 n=1 Tax=Lodderomyces beijingensis TaxID=1775926 RepID=A0ABP0ZQI3_9ASCO